MTKNEFAELASDRVEEYFPKGKTSMRGEAMVLVAMIAKDLIDKDVITDDEEVT